MTGVTGLVCQVCGSKELTEVDGVAELARVTSDSQPFPPGGNASVCRQCGTIQTLPTSEWQQEIKQIYENYKIYNLSQGVEQGVLAAGGEVKRRSSVLAKSICEHAGLGPSGRMLDIGCGNGAMLSSFCDERPDWELFGLELDDKYKDIVEAIPGVHELLVGNLEVAEGEFDVITMLHAIEHFDNPVAFLKDVKKKLKPGGILFIEVPDFAANPFDILVADHCCHFTEHSLAGVVKRAGFDVDVLARNWVAKELSLIARPNTNVAMAFPEVATSEVDAACSLAQANVQWLNSVSAAAKSLLGANPIGLFGTSLAATWVFGVLDGKVDFFVDEDPTRHGDYYDRPVVSPDSVAVDANVFLPFPPAVASSIAERLRDCGYSLHQPPPMV